MATITGTEMIVRNGKALVTPPTISAQGNRVLVTFNNTDTSVYVKSTTSPANYRIKIYGCDKS